MLKNTPKKIRWSLRMALLTLMRPCAVAVTCSSRAGPRAAGAWKKAAWYGIGNSMCRIESLKYTSLLRTEVLYVVMSIICSWVGRSRPEKHRWHVFSLLTSQLLRGQGPLRGGRWVPFSAPCFRQLLFGHAFGPAFGAGDSLIPSARHESTGTPLSYMQRHEKPRARA